MNGRQIQEILAKNSYFNKFFYSHWKSSETKRSLQFLRELEKDDSIKDVSLLRQIRSLMSDANTYKVRDINLANSLNYGIKQAVFGNEQNSIPSIEHGLILYSNVFEDISLTAPISCATMGPFRKEIIQSYRRRPVFIVGPYIQYAKSFYTKNTIDLTKKQNGKTLLVFPSHSTEKTGVSYDEKNYLSTVHKISSRFSTVLVCSYWWNLNDPLIKRFESEGYKIVSAGIRDDISFIKRLKTIITLADFAIGDSVGTHVGYCFSLGTPFSLIDANTAHTTSTHGLSNRADRINEIKSALQTKNQETILRMLKKYWGHGIYRTQEDREIMCDIESDIKKLSLGFPYRANSCCSKLYNTYLKKGLLAHANILLDALPFSELQE